MLCDFFPHTAIALAGRFEGQPLMPIFTVDVSCRSPHHDYAALFAAFRGVNAMPIMDTRWLIDVQDDITVVTDALLRHCASGDGLFVTELAPETRWTGTGLGEAAKAWIRARTTPRPAVAQAEKPASKAN